MTGRFYLEDTDQNFEQGFLIFDEEISAGKYDDAVALLKRAQEFDSAHFREGFQQIIQKYV